MNQGRIWCVVNPTVGLPLLLGSVTLISLTVHATVLSNTTWMADFFQGNKATTTALVTPAASRLASASASDTVAVPMKASEPAVAAPAATADAGIASAAQAGDPPTKG